jgi:hypothetical protein
MKRLLLFFFISVHLVWVLPASGDELKLTPSVGLSQEYNDNIFLDAFDRRSDFITTFTPGIELSDRSERLDANLLLKLNGILYSKTSDLSSVDQIYRGNVKFALSPKLTLSSSAGYVIDSQPDREIETTGLVLGPNKRHRQLYSLSAERVFSETTSAMLAYSYEQDDYNNDRFSDLQYHDVNLPLSHDLGRFLSATKATATLDYSHYDSSSSLISSLLGNIVFDTYLFDTSVDNYAATVGIASALNEKWSLHGSGGGRYTLTRFRTSGRRTFPNTSFDLSASENVGREWGWVGELGVSYKGERTDGHLSFSSDVQPASGQTGGTTIRTGAVSDIRRRFSYELSGSMTLGYYLNKSTSGVASGRALDDETILLTPSIRYEFTRDMYLEASYRYTKVYHNNIHTETDRNSVFVRFYIQNPFFF